MLIGRCRDRTAERLGRRHDAGIRRPHDVRTRRPYDAGTGECKDWMVKGLEVQGLDDVRTGWFMDGKVLVDGNVGRKKEEEKRKLADFVVIISVADFLGI